jgi:hypothetical protein
VSASPSGALEIPSLGRFVKTLCWTAGSLSLLLTATLVAGCGSITYNSTTAQASNGSTGASGNGSGAGSGTGTTGTGTGTTGSGTGTTGTGTGTTGTGTTGTGTTGSGSGTDGGSTGSGSGTGTTGTGTTGTGTTGTGTGTDGGSTGSGTGTTGTGTTGSGTGTTGTGTTGTGTDGGSTGSGSGTGTTGSGSAGTGSSGSGAASTAEGALALVPANAARVDDIQGLSTWKADYDTATSGSNGGASGASSLVANPSMSGTARQFTMDYNYYGGERFYASFGRDTTSKHFLYDVWIYLDGSVGSMANLEMDMNQTMPNGQTAIFGFQCDGWSNTWDYTTNAGTPEKPVDKWLKSDQACNVQDWGQNAWHHVQVAYSRDDVGNVTYQSVWLDGAEQDINATTPSAFALGWGPSLLTNLQMDGRTSTYGSSTVYMDNLTVYRW